MLLASEGILRAANDSPKIDKQAIVPNKVIDTFKTTGTSPASTSNPSRRDAPSEQAGKATDGMTIDPESREVLRYISEDFVMLGTAASLVAYHKESGDKLGKEAFIKYCAKHYGQVLFKGSSGKEDRVSSGSIWWAMDDHEQQVVKSIIMEPTNKSQHDGDPREFNRWYVLKKSMAEPNYDATQEDIATFINHLLYISDDDEAGVLYFLNWLAQLYQFPETKIPVAILMYSRVGGVGKNLVQRLLTKVFGKPLVTGCTGKMLQSNFMDAIEHRRLVFINEVARSEKADGYENFKSMVSEESVSFEGKGRAAREIKNIAHYIITTNNLDALPLMQGDRRIAVLMCSAAPRDEYYYQQLVEWIDGPGAPALANVLRTWEFPANWNPYAPAPQTEAAKLMQRAARGALHCLIEEMVEERMPPFDHDLIIVDEACRQLETSHGATLPRGSINRTTLGKVLGDICGERVQMRIKEADGASKPVKVYILRHREHWETATPEQRGEHMRNGVHMFAVSVGTNEAEIQS